MSRVTPKLLGTSPNREHVIEALSEVRSVITGSGALVALCAVCGETVTTVAVAEEAPAEVKLHEDLVSRVPAAEGLN